MKTHKQRKNKTTKAVIAALLSLLMLFTAFPAEFFSVFAEDGEPALEEPEALEEVEYEPDEEADALYEMTELRTADTKYIKMSDGTVNAVVYDAAVHRKDESGEWTDIDNSLEEGENSFDSSRVSFIKEASGESALFTLRDGSRKITVSMPEAKDSTQIAVINDGKTDGKFDTVYEELTTLTKTFSSVRYNGILPNTDAEYILKGGDLKENLIINDHCEYYTYTFELLLENLIATLAEDGSILLTAEEETAYVFPAPYMYDAEGDCSDAVFYTLEEIDGGKYILTVTADAEWINDGSRVFPVTVDPTIITFSYKSGIEDTYVAENDSANHSNATVMHVGKLSQSGKTKAFVRINNMPSAVGLPLLSAKLTLKCTATPSSLAGKSIAVDKVSYTGNISSITYATTFSTVHHVADELVVASSTEYTFNLLDSDFLTGFSQANSACYRFTIDTNTNSTIAFSTSECNSNVRPCVVFKFGYSLLSGLSNQTIWIANTYQPTGTNDFFNLGILRTTNSPNVEMTTYGNGQEARGHFQLTTGTHGMRIYGAYDMVELYAVNATNNSAVKAQSNGEDWIILRLNSGKYAILLTRDPRLAMTRTATGVKVQTFTGSDSQLWVFYKGINAVSESHPIDSGIYYINSMYTKEFLVNDPDSNGNHLQLTSATEAAYGDKMAWQITYAGDGKYMIQSVIEPAMYLSVDTYGVYLEQHENSLTNRPLYTFNKFASLYYRIKSGSSFYLSCTVTGALCGENTISSGEPNLYLWRLCKKANYNEYNELTNHWIEKASSSTSSIVENIINNAGTWTTASDFSYSIQTPSYPYRHTAQLSASISSSGNLTIGDNSGIIKIETTHKPTGVVDYFLVFVDMLTPTNIINAIGGQSSRIDDIEYTNDGYIVLFNENGLADLLISAGITSLPSYSDNSNKSCILHYDDMYLTSSSTADDIHYSIVCLREDESDGGDSDDPLVKVPFFEFAINKLLLCLGSATTQNKKALRQEIEFTMNNGDVLSDYWVDYFSNSQKDAPYLLADLFVKKIAGCYSGLVIDAPVAFNAVTSNRNTRITNHLSQINSTAGTMIYSDTNKTVTRQSASSLTEYEKEAILSLYSANCNYHSFAAEIKCHAICTNTEGIEELVGRIPLFGNDLSNLISQMQSHANRADLTIVEGLLDNKFEINIGNIHGILFYNLNDPLVTTQANEHPNYN